jgi:serine/threonine protein phosphatase PrpC
VTLGFGPESIPGRFHPVRNGSARVDCLRFCRPIYIRQLSRISGRRARRRPRRYRSTFDGQPPSDADGSDHATRRGRLSRLRTFGRWPDAEHNEDAFVVADLARGEPLHFDHLRTERVSERGTLFMVADGMGGAAAGEIASEMAVEVVLQQMRRRWRDGTTVEPVAFVGTLKAATEVANATIHHYAADHPELRGMGTTATIAGLLGDTLYLAQVGDSRAYLVRDGVAIQITKDQSLMQKLIEAGEITVEEAEMSDRATSSCRRWGRSRTSRST